MYCLMKHETTFAFGIEIKLMLAINLEKTVNDNVLVLTVVVASQRPLV